MNAQRLLKLADGLADVADEHFDMTYFCKSDKPSTIKDRINKRKISCGTIGCALGWAATIFPRSGLKLVKSNILHPHLANDNLKLFSVVYKCDGHEYLGFRAGAEFFDITIEESQYLFEPTQYGDNLKRDKNGLYSSVSRQQVIDRIRKFVKDKQEYQARCTSQNS